MRKGRLLAQGSQWTVRTTLGDAPEVIGARDGGNRPEQLPILLKTPTALSPKKRLVSTLYPQSLSTIDRINRIPLFVQLLRENKDTKSLRPDENSIKVSPKSSARAPSIIWSLASMQVKAFANGVSSIDILIALLWVLIPSKVYPRLGMG